MKKTTRFKTSIAVAVISLVTLCAALVAGRGPVGMAEMTPQLWQEDLRYLAKSLPAKHGDAFHQVSRVEWEAAVAGLDRRIRELRDHEVAVEMGRLVAMIGDGHTELWLRQRAAGFRRLPIGLYFFGEGLYVFAATGDLMTTVGHRVLAIDGMPVSEAYDRVVPLIARDNDFEYLRSGPLYLVVPEILHAVAITEGLDRAVFTLEGPDGPRDVEIAAAESLSGAVWKTAFELSGSPTPLYLQQQDSYYWYEYLEDERTLYLKYNRCRNQKGRESIKRFARELFAFVDETEVERFVIDLRHNTGGNFYRNRPLIDGVLDRPQINKPGKLFVITSRTTFSAATVAAIDFKRETEALIVGEPSRGRPNGYTDEKHLQLPNSGLEVNYSPLYREMMPELGDAPFLPVDIPVEDSFEDYRDGRDRVLETILSFNGEDARSGNQETDERSPLGSDETLGAAGRS